ncbi:hypothetical protein VPH5P1C_0112 [Vibrio phage 5P1c]
MNTSKYIIDKLKSNISVANLLSYMKDKGGCYVAGGAMTAIATGKHDQIEDYDCYFSSREAAVAAIRYMKEDNPHVAFVSDKSITYVMKDTTKIQFIYYDFYPTAEDIFKHFDFTVNMMAYDCRDDSLSSHENFWMHNSQRFLSINAGTKFPIISQLRLDKYIKRGYKTSRNEMLKLSLAIASLNITSWKEAKEQIGNTYGFSIADFNNCEGTDFSIQALIERIESTSEGEGMPMQEQYLYPHDAVDFLISGLPIEYTTINGTEYLVDGLASEVEASLDILIEKGLLEKVEVDKVNLLSGDWYTFESKRLEKGSTITNWGNTRLYRKEALGSHNHGLLYKVTFSEDQVCGFDDDGIQVQGAEVLELVCRAEQVYSFKKGDVVFRENAKMKSHRAKRVNPHLTKERANFINENTLSTGGQVMYARNSFKGIILEGGEDITADELLYLRDGCGVPFGGSCTINADGTYYGEYNTD